jgi:large subunit ribosomal protein L21e
MVNLLVKKSSGYRSRTRALFRKNPREKGKLGLSRILRAYALGDKVCVQIDPGIHKGMPHRRFQGKVGVIEGKRGRAFLVSLKIGDKEKSLIVRPEHITPLK